MIINEKEYANVIAKNLRRLAEPKEETIHAALTAEDIRLLSAYHAATEEQKKIVGYILKINEIKMNIEE